MLAQADESLGEEVLAKPEGMTAAEVLSPHKAKFDDVASGLRALQARRATLMTSVRTQHDLFERAKAAASSFELRQAYFTRLDHGVTAMADLHKVWP